MISSPIKAFLFDLGNVMVRFDFMRAVNRLAPQCECPDVAVAFREIEQIKAAYENGQIKRAAFLRAAFDALRYRGTEAEFITAYEEIFDLNAPMATLVEKLHGKYPLYLLSNTSDIHYDYLFRRYECLRHFAGGTYSHVAGFSKPGREIFDIACRMHGLTPANTLFIDDLLPNIETARSLGFVTHHYHPDRHAELLSQLATAGIQVGM